MMTTSCHGLQPCCRMRCSTRAVRTRVLPLPGPATILQTYRQDDEDCEALQKAQLVTVTRMSHLQKMCKACYQIVVSFFHKTSKQRVRHDQCLGKSSTKLLSDNKQHYATMQCVQHLPCIPTMNGKHCTAVLQVRAAHCSLMYCTAFNFIMCVSKLLS